MFVLCLRRCLRPVPPPVVAYVYWGVIGGHALSSRTDAAFQLPGCEALMVRSACPAGLCLAPWRVVLH